MPYTVRESASCALPSDHWPKIQPVITAFSAGEFCRQLALSNNTGFNYYNFLLKEEVYSLESSQQLLEKDIVQLHAPRYQCLRKVCTRT